MSGETPGERLYALLHARGVVSEPWAVRSVGVRTDYERLAAEFLAGERGAVPPPPMTRVQRETLRLIAQGKTNKEIAAARFVDTKTVRNNNTLLFRQLGVRDRTEAAILAIRNGWLDDEERP